jgi:hypothetical protein
MPGEQVTLEHVDRAVPGDILVHAAPFAAALLVAFNDFFLKPRHPGFVSGKLSDVGLCFLFPVFIAAVLEWADWLFVDLPRSRPFVRRRGLLRAGVVLGALYFIAIKLVPAAADAHVVALHALVPGRRFRAVADPTDLWCLPTVGLAWCYLARFARPGATR